MAKKSVYASSGTTQVEFNMTPMIDITFQLILFFILVGQVASDALAKMMVPKPWNSQALAPEHVGGTKPNRMIINVVSASKEDEDLGSRKDPDSRKIDFYQVDSMRVGKGPKGLSKLESLIVARLKKLPPDMKKDFYVEVRADKRLPFAAVYPVLEIAGRKGVPLMNITAIRKLGPGG